jgi:hypothetical protein
MRIHVIDVDDQSGAHDIHCERGIELIFGRDPVEPDGCFSRTDLAVDWSSLGRSIHVSGSEPERSTRKSCAAAMSLHVSTGLIRSKAGMAPPLVLAA